MKFYLTTAIPYVNAAPHIGHALEYVIADVIHRYRKLIGDNVYFVSGADENALKNVQAAEKAGMEPARFLDKYSKIFADFYKLLEVNLDEFRRGTDQNYHWPGVQKLWQLADKNGDIYKKKYQGLYCVGCEEFKTRKELARGKCPNHNQKPEKVEEENYFFRLSRYQDKLYQLIKSDSYKIYPEKRKNEVLAFIKTGLEDLSISRSNERARDIGVPVPSDNSQKVYVWFDALTIYMTGVGFGYNETLWQKWWPADLHIIGKDIIRFHAVYWPAMLLSTGLPLPKNLLVHGFVSSGGRKMSKTIGNIINPYEIIQKYGVEPFRYYLLSQIPTLDDGDFTVARFKEVYNADLANGLGNLIARVAKLTNKSKLQISYNANYKDIINKHQVYNEAIRKYQLDKALSEVWKNITFLNHYIDKSKPWQLRNSQLDNVLKHCSEKILEISFLLKPFLPATAEKIEKQFTGKIKSQKPLFPRISKS